MITFESLCAALPSLTGEAVKVALWLMQLPSETTELVADLSWRTRTARELLLHVKIVERSLRELADTGLCEMRRSTLTRIESASTSEGCHTLARADSDELPARRVAESEATSHGPGERGLEESAQRRSLELSSGVSTSSSQNPSTAVTAVSPRAGGGEKKSTAASAEVQQCIACFDQHYRDANSGAKPTWGARQYVTMRQLVEKHGAAEVEKRITIMFTAPPRWPAPPYDLHTLSLHFDKFATPSGKGGMIDRWKSGEGYYGGGNEGGGASGAPCAP